MVRRADRVVLPGDGAFPACRAQLFDHRGLFEAMEEVVISGGKPFLGICIGMQMLATRGLEYTETPGFDWIGGTVGPITPSEPGMKVPHMGWNQVRCERESALTTGLDEKWFYFVHSYAAPTGDWTLATSHHGSTFSAVVRRNNFSGAQFHPERSAAAGAPAIPTSPPRSPAWTCRPSPALPA